MLTDETGSAPLHALFGIVMIIVLALGAIQIALTAYSSNAVRAAAYEAARAAIEVGASHERARAVAAAALRRSAGGLVEDVGISIHERKATEGTVVIVDVEGRHRSLGPAPMTFPIRARVSALVEEIPE